MKIYGGSEYLALNVVYLVFCFIYCIVEPKIKKKERNITLFIMLLLFSCLMANRPVETKDTRVYINFFESLDLNQNYSFHLFKRYQQGLEYSEYGFLYLVLFLKKLHLSYRGVFFLVAFFNVIISVSCLQRMKNHIISDNNISYDLYGAVLFGYMAYVGSLHNGISIRAGLSISMSLKAMECYEMRKYKAAIVYGIIAISFQRVCVVLVFAILAEKLFKIRNKKQCIGIWLGQGLLLSIKFGNYCIEIIANIARDFIYKFNINGFSGYMIDFYNVVGKIEWFIWFTLGVCIWAWNSGKSYKYFLRIVLMGGWIIVFLYGVKAISRMYDYFIVFSIPILGARYYRTLEKLLTREKIAVLAVMLIMAAIMLRLSYF